MKTENVILLIAAIAAIVSLISAGFTYYSVSSFKEIWITGFASTTNASVNITINSLATLNFSNFTINWGAGNINPGVTHANLTTSSAGDSTQGGTWDIVGQNNGSTGFVLENVGTVNLTVSLNTAKTAAQFIGGTSPLYQYNVTNIDASTCLNSTGGVDNLNLSIFLDVNITHPGTTICPRMQFLTGSDRVRVNIRLSIPYDSLTGSLSDVVSAAFSQAA